MALHLRSAIRDGLATPLSRNGGVLLVALVVVSVLQLALIQFVGTTYVPVDPATGSPAAESGAPAPGTELPPIVQVAATLLAAFTGGLFTIPVRVVAIRTFVSDYRDRIPDAFVFHRLGRASIAMFASSMLVSIATVLALLVPLAVVGAANWFFGGTALAQGLGTTPQLLLAIGLGLVIALFVLLPPIYVGLGLVFAAHEIVVKDRGVIAAIRGSWRLARGNRLKLLVIVLLPMVAQWIASFAATRLLPETGVLVAQAGLTTIATVFVMGIMARTYVQVADGAREALPA